MPSNSKTFGTFPRAMSEGYECIGPSDHFYLCVLCLHFESIVLKYFHPLSPQFHHKVQTTRKSQGFTINKISRRPEKLLSELNKKDLYIYQNMIAPTYLLCKQL